MATSPHAADPAEAGPVFDHVVIGGGSAGCILGARLSEDPRRSVLLIEAGRDTPPGAVPADIEDVFPTSYSNPDYFWNGSSGASGRQGGFLQPRIMGGGSAVMGMWATRGQPSDYDSWRDAGAVGWGWSDMARAFDTVERDMDFADRGHGDGGAIPIHRHFRESWPRYATAVAGAAARLGLPYRDDINADFADGIFPVPVANDGHRRLSAAAAYLTAQVRSRPNLTIMADTRALKLHVRDGEVERVSLRHGDGSESQVRGREFIVSAGAIHSPALLLRSGIGPAGELTELGIAPVADLPVGRGLQNHCTVNLGAWLKPSARQPASMRTYGLATLRFSSGLEGAPGGDLRIQIVCKTGPYATSNRIGLLSAALYAPKSRGSVTLASPDADVSPKIDFALLSDPDDRRRMETAVAMSLKILRDPEVAAKRGAVVAVGASSFVRRLNRPTHANRAMSRLIALALDLPEPLRGLAMRGAGTSVDPPEAGDAVAAELAGRAAPVFHPVGTCAMGAAGGAHTVVDPDCRVLGIGNLRVVDASIMPSIPTAGTCLPVMAIAEHAAERIIARQG